MIKNSLSERVLLRKIVYIPKTLAIAKHLGYSLAIGFDIDSNLPEINTLAELDDLETHILQQIQGIGNTSHSTLLTEVCQIELEMIKFGSDTDEFTHMCTTEPIINRTREQLLFKSLKDVQQLLFVQNPNSCVYQSTYDIVNDQTDVNYFVKQATVTDTSFFFALRKIAEKHPVSKNNVLGYAIDQQETLVLEHFEDAPKTIPDALNEFTLIYDAEIQLHEKELQVFFYETFQKLLFKKLLIQSKT